MPYKVLNGTEVQTEGLKTPGQTPQPSQMFEAGLNILENDGWALVNIIQGDPPTFIFRREPEQPKGPKGPLDP